MSNVFTLYTLPLQPVTRGLLMMYINQAVYLRIKLIGLDIFSLISLTTYLSAILEQE